jgi:hypothetical protein
MEWDSKPTVQEAIAKTGGVVNHQPFDETWQSFMDMPLVRRELGR